MKKLRVSILGTGSIAEKMAQTVTAMEEAELYAVASRTLERAEQFQAQYGADKAYGAYEALLEDQGSDLVYIALPHSHHYPWAKKCLEAGRGVLCEKAFTVNAAQAKALAALAEKKGVFLCEAMWTRFQPLTRTARELLESGVIGEPRIMRAELCANIMGLERMKNPMLAGGALLDLGIYPLTAVSILFGDDIAQMRTSAVLTEAGVDEMSVTGFTYRDGRQAAVTSCMSAQAPNQILVSGSKGHLEIDGISNWSQVRVFDRDNVLIKTIERPEQITGYEYEVLAAKRAIEAGEIQCEEMPHSLSVAMMERMDSMRSAWGMKHPDEIEAL